MFESFTFLVLTPLSFLDVLRRGIKQITDFSLIMFDECHFASSHSEHPYHSILLQYHQAKFFFFLKWNNLNVPIQRLPKLFGWMTSLLEVSRNESVEVVCARVLALQSYLDCSISFVRDPSQMSISTNAKNLNKDENKDQNKDKDKDKDEDEDESENENDSHL
ncbi:DEAD (Asp-Glu-Ala-Asp) box polypeptide 58, partial [Reticulomyxa filosa]